MRKNNVIMLIAVYVGDIVIAHNDTLFINTFINYIEKIFDIRDMKEPKNYIGLNIKYKRESMSISQPGYIIKLAEKYGQVNCKSTKLPMQVKINLEKEPKIPGEAEKCDQTIYQELIGSVLHLSIYFRPDIACM